MSAHSLDGDVDNRSGNVTQRDSKMSHKHENMDHRYGETKNGTINVHSSNGDTSNLNGNLSHRNSETKTGRRNGETTNRNTEMSEMKGNRSYGNENMSHRNGVISKSTNGMSSSLQTNIDMDNKNENLTYRNGETSHRNAEIGQSSGNISNSYGETSHRNAEIGQSNDNISNRKGDKSQTPTAKPLNGRMSARSVKSGRSVKSEPENSLRSESSLSWPSDDTDEELVDLSDPREKLILSLKREIKVLRNENHYLRQQLEFPAKPRGQLQKENDQKFLKLMKETNGKPASGTSNTGPEKMKQNGASAEEAGLYEMLQEYMVENESLRTENAEMQVHKDKNKQEQQLLYRENERLARRIDELERRMNQQQTGWQNMPRQGSNELVRSRDHSPPRGSPQYARAGGSGGKPAPARLPPPVELPVRDTMAPPRDPVYPGSPPQGYASPTANGGKSKGQGRGQGPLKPPHRLVEPIGQQRPVHEQGGLPYMNGHPAPGGYQAHPGGSPGQYPARQTHIGSPNRQTDIRMDSRRSSQSSSSEKKTTESSTSQDAIRDMNERLKNELIQLEGEIQHHTIVNHHSRNIYGSQGSIR